MMLKEYLSENKNLIDSSIEKYLSNIKYSNVISEGMRYSILNGGKRLRPILLLMVLDLYSKEKEFVLPIAAAIEFIHSYSLVHDDLPALDNDDYRRGKLTTHKKYGEAEAILIGDALLTFSFSLIANETEDINSKKLIKIIGMLSNYAGVDGMIGGQMLDIQSEGKSITLDTLEFIHTNKTGKLLKLPVEIGAILCDASDLEYKALANFSEYLGLAFQIKDDILDIEGEFEKIGKPVGSDLKLDKTTYPSLLGLDKSKVILDDIALKAKMSLNIFEKPKVKLFYELIDYIVNREN